MVDDVVPGLAELPHFPITWQEDTSESSEERVPVEGPDGNGLGASGSVETFAVIDLVKCSVHTFGCDPVVTGVKEAQAFA